MGLLCASYEKRILCDGEVSNGSSPVLVSKDAYHFFVDLFIQSDRHKLSMHANFMCKKAISISNTGLELGYLKSSLVFSPPLISCFILLRANLRAASSRKCSQFSRPSRPDLDGKKVKSREQFKSAFFELQWNSSLPNRRSTKLENWNGKHTDAHANLAPESDFPPNQMLDFLRTENWFGSEPNISRFLW